jgi:choline dehydrogenase-like flavoprotein
MSKPDVWDEEADFVIIGSGAAGATAAVTLAENGFGTLVLEEGRWVRREDFKEDLFSAMRMLFRDFGAQMTRGGAVMPVLEGCAVGGSTVMNGAIIHRLPEAVHAAWAQDKGIADISPFSQIESYADSIESDLGIKRNLGSLLKTLPISATLRRLGWAHEAMLRNAPGCRASGRCLQGCPTGGKWSLEASYIPRAVRAGARVHSEHKAQKIIFEKDRAVGVKAVHQGKIKMYRARRGIVVAAGVLHSPELLWRSGVGNRAHLGRHFQCHLGIGIVGLLDRPIVSIQGPPQGIEIQAFQSDYIKLATQLVPPELTLARTPLAGRELTALLSEVDRFSSWTASVRSEAEGRLRRGVTGKFYLEFRPSPRDLERIRTSLWRLGQLLFEMGAERVFPGIIGPDSLPRDLTDRRDVDRIKTMPLDPKYYLTSVGHLFGTCRMGSDPQQSVVDPHFRVHGTRGLHVIDASVFPSNTGVNPQHSIMSLAMHASYLLMQSSY